MPSPKFKAGRKPRAPKPSRSMLKLREDWLQKAVARVAAEWKPKGVIVPADVQVSCSFPGGGSAHKRIGECWPRERSKAKINEVFINPVLAQPERVLDVLGHELLHAADDCESKHGGKFTKLSKMVGYSGGKHSAAVTPAALAFVKTLAKELGAYPHQEVILKQKQQKENTGLHKFICAVDGDDEGEDGEEAAKPDVLYSTAKMVDVHGIPTCRCHGEPMQLVDREKKNLKEHI